MKSKIFLDIDQDNKPIIKIKSFDNSDDLKDKFLRQFLNNNRPKRKSLDISLSESEREYESQLETDELVSAIGLDKIMMIDAEVLEIKLTNFNKPDNSSAVVWRGNNNDNQESWSEYTIKPKGYVYLLSATKTVKNNSKEYYEWEKHCNCGSEGGEVYDYKIQYNIKLEEAADYIKRGFKVTFANEIEVNLINKEKYIGTFNFSKSELDEIYQGAESIRKFPKKIVESINVDLGDFSPCKGKLDETTLSNIAKMHASNFVNTGITTVIAKNEKIINKIVEILETEHKHVKGSYTMIQESGITTFKKIKEDDNLIPTGIDEKNLRSTGRTTRLIDEYIQSLFNGEKIITYDHDKNFKSNKLLFDKILRRLEREHNINTLDFIILSKSTLEMQLKINRDGYTNQILDRKTGSIELQKTNDKNYLNLNKKQKEPENIDINNYIDELVSLFITNGFVDIDLDLITDKKVFLEFFERKLKNATFDNYNILETVNSFGKKVLSVVKASKKIF